MQKTSLKGSYEVYLVRDGRNDVLIGSLGDITIADSSDIMSGYNIFGIEGTFTDDATLTFDSVLDFYRGNPLYTKLTDPRDTSKADASSSDMFLGEYAYAKGYRVEGTFDITEDIVLDSNGDIRLDPDKYPESSYSSADDRYVNKDPVDDETEDVLKENIKLGETIASVEGVYTEYTESTDEENGHSYDVTFDTVDGYKYVDSWTSNYDKQEDTETSSDNNHESTEKENTSDGDSINISLNKYYESGEKTLTNESGGHDKIYSETYPAITAADIEEGKVAYINGERIVGNGENTKNAINTAITGEGVVNFNANPDGGSYTYEDGNGSGSLPAGANGAEYLSNIKSGDVLGYIPDGSLFSKTGYEFCGWYTEKGYTIVYDSDGKFSHVEHEGTCITDESYGGVNHVLENSDFNTTNSDGSESVTYYAHWQPSSSTVYTVIDMCEDLQIGSYSTVNTLAYTGLTGEKITPNVSTYTGFTSPDVQTVYISYDGTTTVTYKYTRNYYTLSYVSNGYRSSENKDVITNTKITTNYSGNSSGTGSGTITLKVRYQDKVVLTANTLAGYKTTGTGASGTTFTMPANNTSYSVSVSLISYSITYKSGNSKASITNTPGPSTYTVETATITLKNATCTAGYSFNSWSPSSTIAKGSTGNKTFTANITANKYTISISYGEGLSGPSSITVTYGESFTMPSVTAKAGYVHSGWNKYNGNCVYTETSNSSDTAKSSLLTYSINGDGNGGVSQSVSFTVKTSASLPDSYGRAAKASTDYTYYKCTFRSWSGTSSVPAGITGNKTARATWTETGYHQHKGSEGEKSNGCYTNKTTKTKTCTKPGWERTSKGKWYDSSDDRYYYEYKCAGCGKTFTCSVKNSSGTPPTDDINHKYSKLSHNKEKYTWYTLGCGKTPGQQVSSETIN